MSAGVVGAVGLEAAWAAIERPDHEASGAVIKEQAEVLKLCDGCWCVIFGEDDVAGRERVGGMAGNHFQLLEVAAEFYAGAERALGEFEGRVGIDEREAENFIVLVGVSTEAISHGDIEAQRRAIGDG